MERFKNILFALFLSVASSLMSIGLWTLSVWYAHRDGIVIGFDDKPIDLGYLNQNFMHDLLQNPIGLALLAILYYILPVLVVYIFYKRLNAYIPRWVVITAIGIAFLNPMTWIGVMFHAMRIH